jgi:hypothetical protein
MPNGVLPRCLSFVLLNKDIRFIKTGPAEWVVECGSCPAELRWLSSKKDAMETWNKRVSA